MTMSFQTVGHFIDGSTVQHVLLVHSRHGARGLACQQDYNPADFFHVADHREARSCLDATGAEEVGCDACRQALERDYVFDPAKSRTLIGQIACDLRSKAEHELDKILEQTDKCSAMRSAVHMERYRRETGLEY